MLITMNNDINWLKYTTGVGVGLKYGALRNLRLEVSLPVYYQGICFDNRVRADKNNISRFFFQPSAILSYGFSDAVNLDANYGFYHVFERAWCYLCIHKGVQICVNLRPADIQMTIKEVRPTLMCSVPRFWEKVYDGVQEKIAQETGLRKSLMLDAIKVGKAHNLDYLRNGKTPPLLLQIKYKFYEKTVYALLKKTIGIENGNFFPTAGAAVSDEICEFVHSVGINMPRTHFLHRDLIPLVKSH